MWIPEWLRKQIQKRAQDIDYLERVEFERRAMEIEARLQLPRLRAEVAARRNLPHANRVHR